MPAKNHRFAILWPIGQKIFFVNGQIQPRFKDDQDYFPIKNFIDKQLNRAKEIVDQLIIDDLCNPAAFRKKWKEKPVNAYEYGLKMIEKDLRSEKIVENTASGNLWILQGLELILDRPINSFNRFEMKRIVDSLPKENKRSRFSLLRKLFNEAIRDGLISVNPIQFIEAPKSKKKVYVNLEYRVEKIKEKYLAAGYLETKWQPYVRLFLFGCSTGRRIGEIINLKKSDIEGSYIKFLPEKTKRTGRYVRQFLTSEALSYLNPENQSDYLFGEITGRRQTRQTTFFMKPVCEIGEVEYLNFHSSRNYFASRYMRIPGATPQDLAEMMGVTLDTALSYVQHNNKRANEIMERFSIPG